MLKKVFPKKTKILIEVPDHNWSMKNLACNLSWGAMIA